MDEIRLTEQQRQIVEWPYRGNETLYVEGPAGAGKSTALRRRLLYLLSQPIRGESILVLVADRAGRAAIEILIRGAGLGPHGRPMITTYYGLARQMVDLFWPAIAAHAGFAHPTQDPTFLTYETAQYLMHQIVQPLLEKGYFGGLRIRPRRLTSQLLDNLNKAAIHPFPHTEIAERLSRADPQSGRLIYYAQAQECANRFRQACLERNALDVSLTIEVFHKYLLPHPLFWAYFSRQYRHVIVDNVEETVPVAQDMLQALLGTCDSATLAYDEGGGYRILLGVDPDGARRLKDRCRHHVAMSDSFVANPAMRRLSRIAARYFGQSPPLGDDTTPLRAIAEMVQTKYRSEMIAWTAERIARLVQEEGVRPADIAVICPYADGVLRFGLQEALKARQVPFNLVRRWVSFRDDAVARGLLTLTAVAHPSWRITPSVREVAEALHITIAGLDLPRAALLAGQVYRPAQEGMWLLPADDVDIRTRERVGFAMVEAYGQLQAWLAEYVASPPASLDRFLTRLFEELLCLPAFWSSEWPGARMSCARLIDSARKFRWAAPAFGEIDRESPLLGRDYCRMIEQGIVAGRYVEEAPADESAVLLVTPVYAYLLEDRVSDYQFWMDVGSREWWRPPFQPLTNPIVLSRHWDVGTIWDEEKDYYLRNWLLWRMIDGLTKRCRKQIFLCGSDIDSMGNPQDGPLFPALQPAFALEGLV